jgi:ketosteroid isomerase-like protein
MTAFTGNDAAALGAVFAENAVIMPPGEPAKEGLAALTAWAQAIGEQYTVAGEYTSTDVIVSGDWAVQRFTGRLSMTPKAGGDMMSETIKGVHVLHRSADGTWRITQDVWNADQPPPPPPAAGSSF